MSSLPVRRFSEVRALLLAVIVLLVLGSLLSMAALYVTALAPREEPDALTATAAAVAAALRQGEVPFVPVGRVRLALYRNGVLAWQVGTVPGSPYWPYPDRASWERAGRPTAARGEWQGQALAVVLWPVHSDELLQVVAPVEEGSQRWLAVTLLLSLVLGVAGGGLAWFLVGRVLAPYGELLEEARRFAGRTKGGPEDRFLVGTFRQAVRRVEEQERELAGRAEELSELAAGLAHELRNNLSVMDGYLRLARDNPAELPRYLQALAAEVQSQREFLERFMTFVHPAATGRGEVHLRPLLEHLVARLSAAFPQVALRCQGDGEVRADPTAVRVILENLLRNACEAAAKGSERWVEVVVDAAPRQVQVVVRDSGPGIPAGLREGLFQPFVSEKPSGGIGLALARRLARNLGGEVELVSPGDPTVFVARFPRGGAA